MTLDEMGKVNMRGEAILDADGKRYKVFVCHGCQTCWAPIMDNEPEAYPHFLSVEELKDG